MIQKLTRLWFLLIPLLLLALILPWRQTAVDAAPITKAPLDEALVEMAQANGLVPVIVGLHLSDTALKATDEAAQMAAIEEAQTAVLNALAGHTTENVKLFPYIPFMALWVDEAGLLALHQAPGVTAVIEDAVSAPHTASSSVIIRSDSANNLGYRGQGQTVAVLDTGVNRTHPDLNGKIVSEACYSTTNTVNLSTTLCPNGSSSQTGTGAANPPANFVAGYDHGTHVAGIVAGVAPQANIIAIQVFSRYSDVAGSPLASLTPCANSGRPSPCTFSYASDQILGLQRVYALRNSYNIAAVNMSLGGGAYSSSCDSLNAALTTSILSLRNVGIATVISAGNNGYRGNIGSPACISYAISVGATTSTPGPMTPNLVPDYSNAANIMTMFAPGGSINSAVPTWATNCGPGIAPISNRCYKQGTSMAAPHVAGALAVMRSAVPAATVSQMISAFTSTGPLITDGRIGGTVTKRRLDVYAATCQLAGCDQDDFRTFVLGQNLVGTVGVGSDYTDVYYFNGTANQRLRLSMIRLSGTLDPFLILADPYGSLVALNDNGGGGTNALIDPVYLPYTGRYTIYANSQFGSGGYQLTVSSGTYLSNPVPTLLSLNRTSATINSPAGFWVGITGNNFLPSSVVRWNGSNRPTSYSSSTFIWGWVYPTDMTALGTNTMTVFNPTPGGGTSFGQGFQITAEPLGTSEMLSPLPDSSVPVGMQQTFAISWTHPISSWRVMQNIDIRLKDVSDQTALWLRFTEGSPTSTLSLLNSSGEQIGISPLVSGQWGEPEEIVVTDTVTLHMADTIFFGSGQTVIISPTVSFGSLAPGRYMVEFTVNNDEGEIQDADVVGAFYVLPPGCDTVLTAVSLSGPTTGMVNTDYQFTVSTVPPGLPGVSYTWSPEPVSGQGTAVATFNWSETGPQPVNVVAQHCSGFLADVASISLRTTTAPDLEIGKTAPPAALAGQPITYTLTVRNNGAQTATNLEVTDSLPAGATYVSGGTLVGDEVRWTIPSLAGYGAEAAVSVVVTAVTDLSNETYSVTADGGHSASGLAVAVTRLADALVAVTPGISETLAYGGNVVTIPEGSVFAPTQVAYTELETLSAPLPGSGRFANRAFRLDAYQEPAPDSEWRFGERLTFVVTYSDGDISGLDETLLRLLAWEGSQWRSSGISCTPDMAANTLTCTAETSAAATFALFEYVDQLFLPMIVR